MDMMSSMHRGSNLVLLVVQGFQLLLLLLLLQLLLLQHIGSLSPEGEPAGCMPAGRGIPNSDESFHLCIFV